MQKTDRKSTRLNSSHTVIYTLSLHDALPIFGGVGACPHHGILPVGCILLSSNFKGVMFPKMYAKNRSEEHTSELQSHSDLHSFPTRRSSDLWGCGGLPPPWYPSGRLYSTVK